MTHPETGGPHAPHDAPPQPDRPLSPAPDGVLPVELPVATAEELQRLEVARTLLLKVHRALLEAERVRYEKARGRIENNSAFLQLVINDPWFDWLPFRSARGTVLQVEADTGRESRIINRGCWLLPRGDGTLRAGPTYELDFGDPFTPSASAIEDLEATMRILLKRPYKVIGSQTGVRPIIPRCHALIGLHPARPHIGFINALGSKGVLRAPWAARQFTEHLLDGKTIEPELDLARNL